MTKPILAAAGGRRVRRAGSASCKGATRVLLAPLAPPDRTIPRPAHIASMHVCHVDPGALRMSARSLHARFVRAANSRTSMGKLHVPPYLVSSYSGE